MRLRYELAPLSFEVEGGLHFKDDTLSEVESTLELSTSYILSDAPYMDLKTTPF